MRTTAVLIAATLVLGACSKGDKQADALDHAAAQADPAAADAMHNAADQIRDSGSDANVADPNSPAQAALVNAGAAAAQAGPETGQNSSAFQAELVTPRPAGANQVQVGAATPSAQPHRAGQPVPNSTGPAHP